MNGASSRRIGLRVKIVSVLLAIALAPLLASTLLINEIAEVAQNFASHHAAQLRPHMERSQQSYRDLVAAKKALYEQVARGVAADLDAEDSPALSSMLPRQQELVSLRVLGEPGASASRPAPAGEHRLLPIRVPLADGRELEATFAADLDPVRALRALGDALEVSRRVDTVRSSLPSSYRNAFLLLVGGVVVAVTALGLLLARRLVRRLDALVAGTREVAGGDLQARVALAGRDELAELAAAFNTMVEDLGRERQKILYLQRIGAWQDVARRLAHEIKNPLTPIQLAVQQCVSQYDGSDPRHAKLLADTEEIVGEEIAGLRRLVDAFSALGRLPRVEAAELPLATVAADLEGDPGLRDHLRIRPPAEPVVVRADRLLVRRVLANLVENGIQAGGAAGEVVLAWRVDGDRAVVTVDDAGPGIAADQRGRIFEPYVTSKDTGTGLGLAIAKKIALDHGGSLTLADDPAPTGGARFVLTLPLAG